MDLLTTKNPKSLKGEAHGYLTAILHLLPGPLCPNATEQCLKVCLNTAGRAGIVKKGETTNVIQKARQARTDFFRNHRQGFLELLSWELKRHTAAAERRGLKPAVRLNGTSDIPWEKAAPTLFDSHKDIQFYDYTKSVRRAREKAKLPPNYHLTFSRSEVTPNSTVRLLLSEGVNVAAVYDGKPDLFDGDLPVVDGDRHDLTFLWPDGVIVALTPKGKAKKSIPGNLDHPSFVVRYKAGESLASLTDADLEFLSASLS